MNVVPTYHALLRWNERVYNNYTDLNMEVINEEIVSDFKNAKFISKDKSDGIEQYRSKDNTFIVESSNDEITIITMYPNENPKEIHNQTKYYSENINIKTRLKFTSKQLKLISNIFKQEDYITLQTIGSKKYIVINDFILLVRTERMNERISVAIINKWEIDKLYDLEQFELFKKECQQDFKSKEWVYLLELLQINKKIFIAEQFEKETLSEEALTYKKVLSGELKQFPHGFWNDDIGLGVKIASKLCVKYLFEEVLKWDLYDIYQNFNPSTLKKYKLSGMCKVVFSDNYFNILDNAYPNKFKPWFFKKVKFYSYWKQENEGINRSREAIKWMVEEAKKDGFVINDQNLLGFDWVLLLEKYNLKEVLSITFNSDYRSFFKEIFDIEFSDEDISRYVQHFELKLNQGFVQMHI